MKYHVMRFVLRVFKPENGGTALYSDSWCGNRDLNPSPRLGKPMY